MVLAMLVAAAGCGGEAPIPGPPTEEPPAQAEAPVSASSGEQPVVEPDAPSAEAPPEEAPPVMHGPIDFVLYEEALVVAGPQRPNFRVTTSDVREGADGIVRFTDAEATIYSEDGEDVHVTAAGGWFDQENKQAALEGTVRIVTEGRVVEVNELVYDNTTQELRSDKPVLLVDGETELRASAMRYYPQKGRSMLLVDLSGTLMLDGLIEDETLPNEEAPDIP
jgi:hypothetical protein